MEPVQVLPPSGVSKLPVAPVRDRVLPKALSAALRVIVRLDQAGASQKNGLVKKIGDDILYPLRVPQVSW